MIFQAAKQSIYLFYAVRVIEGLGEGVTFPATMAIIAKWATPEERSRSVLIQIFEFKLICSCLLLFRTLVVKTLIHGIL